MRDQGDWEAWLTFFLDGVRESAEGAMTAAQRLDRLFQDDRERIADRGRKAGSALRVHAALKRRPIATIQDVADRSGLTFPTVAKSLELLVRMGVVREITGKQRNRVFARTRSTHWRR